MFATPVWRYVGVVLIATWSLACSANGAGVDWTDAEKALIRSLELGSDFSPPPSVSNQYANDERAVRFGHQLFFDKRFSSNGEVACSSCHIPEKLFIDGSALATGGLQTTDRKTMTIIGVSISPWLFWDGRKDSLWSQALGPWESPVEHGGDRAHYAHLVAKHYAQTYERIFGPLPSLDDDGRFPLHASPNSADPLKRTAWDKMAAEDQDAISTVFVNMGKAVAAYQRQFLPGRSRFDQYAQAVHRSAQADGVAGILTPEEEEGLRLFISEEGGRCIQCHNGPLFTNNEFHNTGVPPSEGRQPDRGRLEGVKLLLDDEFNCLGRFSDATPDKCDELTFINSDGPELEGAMRTPSLRNIAHLAPFMHQGQFASLDRVLAHYNDAPASLIGHSELRPLGLDERQLASLSAFLTTLDGGIAAPQNLLQPPFMPE